MTVSVIMPAYNGALYIAEALESIAAQHVSDLEVIVVDDGSTDDTAQIVQKFKGLDIRYIHQHNSGPSGARNAGIRLAKGDLIAFLDADDRWPVSKLEGQLSFLKHHTATDVVAGLIDYFYMPGSEYRKEQLKIDTPVFNVQLGGLLVRRSVFESVGYFNEQLRFSEDQDWILRVREAGINMHILQEVVLLYRIHPGNVTVHRTLKDLGVLKALKLSLDRRRQGTADSLNTSTDERKH